jgi:hypothetical protein
MRVFHLGHAFLPNRLLALLGPLFRERPFSLAYSAASTSSSRRTYMLFIGRSIRCRAIIMGGVVRMSAGYGCNLCLQTKAGEHPFLCRDLGVIAPVIVIVGCSRSERLFLPLILAASSPIIVTDDPYSSSVTACTEANKSVVDPGVEWIAIQICGIRSRVAGARPTVALLFIHRHARRERINYESVTANGGEEMLATSSAERDCGTARLLAPRCGYVEQVTATLSSSVFERCARQGTGLKMWGSTNKEISLLQKDCAAVAEWLAEPPAKK